MLKLKRIRDRGRGQALVEFALSLPIALLILMGLIQFGFLFAGHIGVTNAIRETARFGSTSPVNDTATASSNASGICTYLKGTAMTRVPGYSSANVVTSGGTQTTVSYASYTDPHSAPNTYSVRLTVHVEYKHPLLVPIVSAIIDGLDGSNDNSFQLGATEAMRVENPILTSDPSINTTVNCP
jgi:Flp pilus assembly protein TadG